MQIITEPDFSGLDKNHKWAEQFQILNFSQGGTTLIPHNFFVIGSINRTISMVSSILVNVRD